MNFPSLQWVGAGGKLIVIAQQEANASAIEKLFLLLLFRKKSSGTFSF